LKIDKDSSKLRWKSWIKRENCKRRG